MSSPIQPSPLDPESGASPPARFLSNGRYVGLITGTGTGFSRSGEVALTAWNGDRVEDRQGLFIYLRDAESRVGWSMAHWPPLPNGTPLRARWTPGRFEIARDAEGIEARLEVCVAVDCDAEIRRLILVNRSPKRRVIELTTYAEVVLNEPAAHAAHPAFSKLFVQTEHVPTRRALLARRRPRAQGERYPWLVHALLGAGVPEVETDRSRFLGRRSSTGIPEALATSAPLSGTTGNVLDPIVSLRWTVSIEAGATARCAILLGTADGREEALALAERFAAEDRVETAFVAAAAAERERYSSAGLVEAEAEACQAVAGAMLFGDPTLRPAPEALARVHGDLSSLARLGVSSGRPFAVANLERPATAALLGDLLKAHRYWRSLGLPIDLVLVHAGAAPIELANLPAGPDHPVLVPAGTTTPAELDLLNAAARWAVVEPPAAAAARLRAARSGGAAGMSPPSIPRTDHSARATRTDGGDLAFFNGVGGFSPAGDEYVIRIGASGPRPPRPWTNVIGSEHFGFVLSETGSGATWSGNSREHRLTPWSNDAVLDPHGEAFYIRDEDTGAFWSPLPGPAPGDGDYEMRHGFGYSVSRHASAGLDVETTLFAAREDPVRITALRIVNQSRRTRRLSLFAYYRLVLGVLAEESGRFVVTEIDPASKAVFARNRTAGTFAEAVTFAGVVASAGARAVHATCDRESFIGRGGTPAAPRALRDAAPLDGRTGAALDPCIAQQVVLEVPAGATREVLFLFGEARSAAAAREMLARHGAPEIAALALGAARDFWRLGVSGLRVTTPSSTLDLMMNGWLPYQTLACRIWGRSAFYQSGGAYGFRDQLQDAAALVTLWPRLAREQILLNAAHQFVEGDVLHWWHPPLSRGIRTRFADDLVWLPYLTAHYIRTTGDAAVLDERVRFLTAPPLAPGEDEAYLEPRDSGESADLYDHCCRALDRALTQGRHGLPLFGSGDWNDGMNRVGREGRGESVWMAFFLIAAIADFLPLCESRGDSARASRYRAYRERLLRAVEETAWDGAWYVRAYYDDGTPLGSKDGDECRIDALVQAWAVISGAAPRARAEQAMDAVESQLISEKDGLIRLLTPPFDRTPHDPGYIKGYVPGVRENGGQYTHAALWVVRALAELGRNDRAARLLDMLNPVNHARTPDEVATYQVEPYVVAADVYGAPPHVGRGGWTWYTGSAGWMYRVALESILGFTIEGGATLVLAPCVPDAWPEFTIEYRLPEEDTRYEIIAGNPHGRGRGAASATLDGAPVPVMGGAARIPIVHDGRLHRVAIVLGADTEPAP
jgi:cyclic beta-1,2-glucan synthetase